MNDSGDWLEFDRLFGGVRTIGEALLPIMDAERDFGDWIENQRLARSQLVEATLGFFVESIYLSRERFVEMPEASRARMYVSLLAWYAAHFRRFRAAEIAFYSGYGISATSLLRDIRDWGFQVAAMQCGAVSWSELHGDPAAIESGTKQRNEREDHKRALAAQKAAQEWAIGKTSGLSGWQALEKWARYSNLETHGSLVTTSIEFEDWLRGTGALSFAPKKNLRNQRMYCSRSTELGHLMLRLLPILQVRAPFGEDWNAKWRCLDKLYSQQWSAENATARYMSAFGEMVAAKFNFPPEKTRLSIEVTRSDQRKNGTGVDQPHGGHIEGGD